MEPVSAIHVGTMFKASTKLRRSYSTYFQEQVRFALVTSGEISLTCLTLSAVNVSVENIDVHPHDSGSPTVICDPSALAPGEQSTLGFLCKTGPYVATEIGSSSGGIKVAETKMVVLGLTGALGLALLL